MKLLIAYGADVNQMNFRGQVPIHKVANSACCEELIKAGVNPNTRDVFGYTPLHFAAKVSSDLVKTLLDKGANPFLKNLFSTNCLANAKSREVVDLLVAQGLDPQETYRFGERAIHCADEADVIKALVEHGADVDATDNLGETALHKAKTAGAAQALIECGADVHALNKKGRTPFKAHKSNREIYRLLLAASEKRKHKILKWWHS
ncbi:MAG: ankyrin repeat protein [Chlamydiales bacterium]|jgi:ankyrin repeat protein